MKYKNDEDFLYMDNYKALLACILNDRISVDKAVKIVALQSIGNKGSGGGVDIEKNTRPYKKRKRCYVVETYAYDTLKDTVIKFRSQREAAIALGVARPTISKNTDKGTLVLKRYKFTSKEPKKDKLRGINKC